MKQKIIDAHMHPDFSEKALVQEASHSGVDFTLSGLSKDFKKYNIVKAIALPEFVYYFTGEKITPAMRNDKIKKLVTENPDKFIGVCTLNPANEIQDDINVLEQSIKKGVFKAIKLYLGYEPFYPNDKSCSPIYELAERNRIPVMFHTGDTWNKVRNARLKYTHPLNIDDVSVSFPKLKIVICHMGNPWLMDATEVVYKNENVYADLSGFFLGRASGIDKNYREMMRRKLLECFYFCGYDKIMFGTDYPLVSHEFYIKFINSLGFSKKELNKIFFENAIKVFNIKL